MPLNFRQLKFAEGVIAGKPASQAYRDAGYKPKTDRTAESAASLLLRNVEVAAMIAAATRKAANGLEITAERVLKEMARLAYSDIRSLYRPDGTLKPVHEWDDDTAATVASLEVDEHLGTDGSGPHVLTRKVKRFDKKGPLELLAKYLGLLTEKVELTGAGGGPLQVEEIVVRTRQEASAVAVPEAG